MRQGGGCGLARGRRKAQRHEERRRSVVALGICPVPRIISGSIRIVSGSLRLIPADIGPIPARMGPIGATRRPNVGTGAAIRAPAADVGHVVSAIGIANCRCDAVMRRKRQRVRP